MGSNGVSELYPDRGGGGDPAPSYAYKLFEEAFPEYLSIGMTYEQFWEQDVCLVRYYRKSFRRKQERKNHELWLQGAYIYDAISRLYPLLNPLAGKRAKVEPYPEEPYSFSQPKEKRLTKEQQSDNKAKAVMEMFMVNINKKFERKGGDKNGS